MKKFQFLVVGLVSLVISGCATTQSNESAQEGETNGASDSTLESYNRSMHGFNQGVFEYVLQPIGTAVDYVVPDIVQDGLSSILENLSVPNSALNNALQGKFSQAGEDLGRFGINTTVGLLGLIDWASMMGLEGSEADFGQTLGVWGVSDGPYVVLPVMGGTTVRGVAGTFVAYDPLNSASQSARDTVNRLSNFELLLIGSDIEDYPSYDEQKAMYLAQQACAVSQGTEQEAEACQPVCEQFSKMMEREMAEITDAEELMEMQKMSGEFMPPFCRSQPQTSAQNAMTEVPHS